MDLDRMHRILPHLYLGDLKDMEMVNLCVPFMKSLEDVAAAINASTTNASADGASTTSVTASATAITSATTVATTKYNKTEVSEIIHSFKNTPMLHQLSRITHILTLLPDTSKAYAPLSHCIFEIEDSENADILTLLPQCIKFIDDAIESGGTVLVHCYAGVSRSASVVISYIMYLSKRLSILNKNRVADAAGTAGTADTANTASETNNSENSSSSTTSTTTTEFAIKSTEMHEIKETFTFEEAYKRVKNIRTFIHPNPGFQNQLRLFYLMDCQLDYSHKAYRWHKIRTILFRGMHSHLWKAPFEEYIEKYTLDAVTPQRKSKSDPPSPVATDVNATADATATIDTTTTATTSATKQSASYLRFLKWSSSNNTNNTNTTEEQKPQDEEQQVQPAPRNPLAESISCRKCNKLLCTDANILNHPINIFQKKLPTEGFIDRETEIIIQHKDASDNCSVIFIEPMRWMRPQLLKSSNSQLMSFQSTENKGWFKLHCPDCFTKIGLFSFSSYVHCPECAFPRSFGAILQPNRIDRKYNNILEAEKEKERQKEREKGKEKEKDC